MENDQRYNPGYIKEENIEYDPGYTLENNQAYHKGYEAEDDRGHRREQYRQQSVSVQKVPKLPINCFKIIIYISATPWKGSVC